VVLESSRIQNAYCYIIFSENLNKYYVGSTTETIIERLEKHITEYYEGTHFTHSTKDWNIYLTIPCLNRNQAKKVEAHIKRMKSKKYIQNLKEHPQIIKKLLNKYS
jgi:putative endonuclease